MKNDFRLRILKVTGSEYLVGKIGGQRDLPKFMNAVAATPDGCTVILDWSGIELASASYFGSAIIPVLRMTTTGDLDRYFIFANVNQNSLDELKLVVEFSNFVVLLGDIDRNNALSNVRVVGKLESPYSETFEAISRSQTASAAMLHEAQNSKAKIGKTGWANRLAYLSELRLVRKQRVGRELVFQPIYGGDQNGR
jgi:hypothetical protein